MKRIKFQSIAMLFAAVVLLMASSCKREYDRPPLRQLDVDTVFTIEQIINMGATSFNFAEGVTGGVYGIVTADEVSGNLYKTVYIQDRASSKAINLYMSSSSGLRIGDSICVVLNGTVASTYNNLPQLGSSDNPLDPDDNIVILDNQKYIEPKVVTIAEINQSKYTAQLIKLEGVQFVQPGLNFADDGGYGQRYVKDAAGNQVMIRTSNYANFAERPTPAGTGSIIAINSIYGSTQQLYIRSINEVVFDGGGGSTAGPGETQSLPYAQLFATDFGTYTTKDVAGAQSWSIDYSTAKMTGFESSTNYANEDWLISSPISLEGVTSAKVAVAYICRYFADLNNDMTIQVSTDYVWDNDPTTATWTPLSFTWTAGTDWNTFANTEGDLSAYAGQTITIAVKYLSTDTKAGTAEIQSITVSEGTTTGGGGGGGNNETTGDGTRNNPYTIADVISLNGNDPATYVWVRGYIVGQVNGMSIDDSEFAEPWTSSSTDNQTNTNILIADAQNTNVAASCAPVQLPAGALRNALNLPGNPTNYNQEVLIYGTLQKYFGKPGIKTPSYAEMNGQSYGSDPGTGTETVYFNESLLTQASFNNFSVFDVNGDQTWTWSTSGYGATMSGYADNASHANEDWLISPVIDLSGATAPVLTFDHARGPAASINVGINEGYYTVWVTNAYTDGDDPTDDLDAWTELTGITHGTAGWAYVSSGQVAIPAAYCTSTCRIAFKYLCTDTESATWEIKNVKIMQP